jgi:hypothetical protein
MLLEARIKRSKKVHDLGLGLGVVGGLAVADGICLVSNFEGQVQE